LFLYKVQQDGNSSSIQLKSEFQNYEILRRAYNSQIIQMAIKDDKSFFVFFCSSYI